ncbi:hypothetical protein ACIP5N_33900 [Streptomyces sp. NPDC088768]|uniref:hypothetical protein n=1 Tax=Streptomyces sp. NPDC088768 TaxID=3365894 RepID=UPI00380D4B16
MLALLLAALIVGYMAGRTRPYDRLADWADWQVRFHLDRWTTRPRMLALFTLLLFTDPARTLSAWRRRNDP